ncbi:MAG: RpiB/LacA/LacB family sugar-phosphate isomerase [Holosporaceae bacterium]|jgi:ribose 5-phosphate isomerase B|nr:RpiB/LacA/LacB family sugar-phosphate isomerase [Holosporaceae bacterium]
MVFEKIFIASDHGGFNLKRCLTEKSGLEMTDLGTRSADPCDYPVFVRKLADAAAKTKNSCGVLICRTGVGMTIAANRYAHIRAALCYNEKIVELSRRHNDANVAVFGGDSITPETALNYLEIFLNTEFEGGRHAGRLKMINDIVFSDPDSETENARNDLVFGVSRR